MESTGTPSRISRVDNRYRHLAQDVAPRKEAVGKRAAVPGKKEEEFLLENVNEPLLIREQRGRPVMGRAHRAFHRRAAPSPNILTVAVEVVATLDGNGNVIAQETITPALPSVLAVPSVPSVPSVALPSVPSVPAFPSDLTVPAYPWPSGVSSIPTSAPSSPAILSSTTPTITSNANSVSQTPFPSSGFNATISSTLSSSNFLSSLNSTSSTSSSSSSSLSLLLTSSTSRSSTASRQPSTTQTFATDFATPTSSVGGGGGGGGGGADPAATSPPPTSTSAALAGATSNSNPPLDTPQTVGTVVGSLAGAALILALVLFLIKRHRQRQHGGALQLPEHDGTDVQPVDPSTQQQMTMRSSFVPTGAVAFFNRFSGASRSTAETSTTGERSFQRISGRKLPSAFSEGMTSEQFTRGEGTLSGSSFYRDDHGFYGGPGIAGSKEFGKETGDTSNVMTTQERMMPSPARTPIIHHPEDAPPWGTSRNGGATLSPPHSPNPDFALPTLGRSLPSHDGSRSSRFTENV